MDFNKLYKKIAALDQGRQILNESEQPVEECGMMGMSPLGGMDERPTTMSVNMNASGAEGIRELLGILQGKGDDDTSLNGPDPGPAGAILSIDSDDSNMDLDADTDDNGDDEFDIDGDNNLHKQKPMFGREPDIDEEYANEANPTTMPQPTAGDDMHKPKREYPAAAGGGNPMQQMSENLRRSLLNLYNEIKVR